MNKFIQKLSITSPDNDEIFYDDLNDIKSKKYIDKKIKKKIKKEIELVNFTNQINNSDFLVPKIFDYEVERELSYFEKQNLFFKENRNNAKKIPIELAFKQIFEENGIKLNKSFYSTETNDYDKITPKSKKDNKEIEILNDKDLLEDLFKRNKV